MLPEAIDKRDEQMRTLVMSADFGTSRASATPTNASSGVSSRPAAGETDLQNFVGHADPRTTFTYVCQRDRLSKSPAYTLKN